MKKIICILLSACLICGCNSASKKIRKEKGEALKMMIATDLHLLASAYHDGKEASSLMYQVRDGKMVQYGTEICKAFVDTALNEEVDAVILTGDLTFNGEKASHQELAKLLQPLERAGIHVLVIPGNHDIRNPFAYSFKQDRAYAEESIEAEEFAQIYARYGYADAISRDAHSLSYLYQVSEEFWFLMVDASRYQNNTSMMIDNSGRIQPETLEWMQECLEMAKKQGAEVFIANHYYVFPNPHMEYMSDFQLQNAGSLIKLMNEYDVNVVFSGHTHAQSMMTREENGVFLVDITTESLAVAEHLFGMVEVNSETLTYEARPLDVDSWAKSENLSDEHLLNFHEYSWNHFADLSTALFASNYAESSLDEKSIAEISALLGSLNPYFFSGKTEHILEDVRNSKGYSLIQKLPYDFSYQYLQTMIEPRKTDQRKIEIPLKS